MNGRAIWILGVTLFEAHYKSDKTSHEDQEVREGHSLDLCEGKKDNEDGKNESPTSNSRGVTEGNGYSHYKGTGDLEGQEREKLFMSALLIAAHFIGSAAV